MTTHDKPDQSFDAIADKFQRNIYGSTKGKLRHDLLLSHLKRVVPLDDRPLRVLDVGGGTGVMSHVMLALGHEVTLNDLSSDCLNLAQAAIETSHQHRLKVHHGPFQSLPGQQAFDLVICHAVLEWLQDPLAQLPRLLERVKPGGYLSLSFFNRDAQTFGNILYGNFDYVQAGLKVKKKVRLSPHNALVPQHVLNALGGAGEVVHQAGIRCFHDYLKEDKHKSQGYEQLLQLELQHGRLHPYMWLGKYFHLIIRTPT